MSEELKEQVSNALDEATTPAVEKSPEIVTSPDVKTESAPTEPTVSKKAVEVGGAVKTVDEWKLTLQIENLNKALIIEREEKAKLRADFDKVQPFVEKMQNAFAPEPIKEEPVTPTYMTPEQLETWFSEKEAAKRQEVEQTKLKDNIDSQIKSMTEKWDGKDGKPQYNDGDVIAWQRDNNKLYLMPDEAFLLMKRDEIINWETKQLMSKEKSPVSGERPSGISAEHTPGSVTPKTDQEIKSAILEALNTTDEA